jgi:hypothetical protein
MGRAAPVKHGPYFDVLEALRGTAGCALCDLELRAQHRYFDALLYENVNDPGVRGDLARSHGYCARHAHALVGFQDASGIAILYQDQVELFGAFLCATVPARRQRRRRHGLRERDVRRNTVSTVITWLHDPDFAAAFVSASGPCAPHVVELVDAAPDDATEHLLIETHRAKLQGLAEELREFRRKSGVEGQQESFGRERDAWKRAVALMVGSHGVF